VSKVTPKVLPTLRPSFIGLAQMGNEKINDPAITRIAFKNCFFMADSLQQLVTFNLIASTVIILAIWKFSAS
jgi:hypothetical protein